MQNSLLPNVKKTGQMEVLKHGIRGIDCGRPGYAAKAF